MAIKAPPGLPWIRRHFLSRQGRCRWQAERSKRRFRKTPLLLCVKKCVAGGGNEPIGGSDEIKRRDRYFWREGWLANEARGKRG